MVGYCRVARGRMGVRAGHLVRGTVFDGRGAGKFITFRIDASQPQEKQEASLEADAHAEGAHGGSHIGNPVRARSRRLLSRRPERQMGLQHRRRDAEIPVGQRHRADGQARRRNASKARARFGHRRRLGSKAGMLLDGAAKFAALG